MLGRLSAATAALEATQIPNVPSDSDSESEHSSYTERYIYSQFEKFIYSCCSERISRIRNNIEMIWDRSRGSSPNANNVHRGYSCGSCDVVAPTRPALRKHIADCHPTLNGTETRESRTCPASGCDFTTNSRCEMETHVAAHVAQGMTPTGKKRTLALQRVRYRYSSPNHFFTYISLIHINYQKMKSHLSFTSTSSSSSFFFFS